MPSRAAPCDPDCSLRCPFRGPRSKSPAPALHSVEPGYSAINTVPSRTFRYPAEARLFLVRLSSSVMPVMSSPVKVVAVVEPKFASINATHRHNTLSLLQGSTLAFAMRISWLRTPQGLPTLPHLTARSPSTFLPRLIEKVLMMAHLAIPTQGGFNLASIARPDFDVLHTICRWLAEALTSARPIDCSWITLLSEWLPSRNWFQTQSLSPITASILRAFPSSRSPSARHPRENGLLQGRGSRPIVAGSDRRPHLAMLSSV